MIKTTCDARALVNSGGEREWDVCADERGRVERRRKCRLEKGR